MKILLTGAFKCSEEQLNIIKALGHEIVFVQDERKPLNIDVTEIEAVVCNGLFLYNDISKFKILKFIQLTSAGLDRVPLNFIQEHSIQIFNAKGVYSIPMAEWVVLKILEIYKDTRHFYNAQSEHHWLKKRGLLELTGRTAAIIGFGSVGNETAKRLKAFDVNVVGVDIRRMEYEFIDEAYMIDDIDVVLNKSDIIILTLPLTGQTHHLFNRDRFTAMKDDSVLINVSRGGLVDEVALVEALQSGKFRGVALDVFEQEPLQECSPLWNYENVIITPHNSFVSDRVNDRLFKLILENLRKHLNEHIN